MRLGDLDELKSEFDIIANNSATNEWQTLPIKHIKQIIDKALTVELTEEQAIDKLHETGWLPKHDKEMTERPVAEILPEHCIDTDCKSCYNQCTWFKCSNCSCKVNKDDRFCSHCGANLGGEQ